MQISSRGFNKDNLSLAVDVLTFALTIFGVFVVYSASYYQSQSLYGDEFLYLKKQIFGVFLGWISFFIIKLLGTDFLKKFYIVLPIIAAVLLCLVFIPGISVEAYGARRWINLGFFTIQPSEIAKFALVVFSAVYFEKNYRKTKGIV
ncbi:MAG: FtsW/RodA/SpoVE family cell cycle protein, partial [Clostridia bacterium]|nr:FtsW/RodA/SpoVE family cell cycle protein [Clostridia bacterium]